MLLRVPDLLSEVEVTKARAELAGASWVDGRSTAGAQAAHVKSNRQLPPGSEAERTLQRTVVDALSRSPLFFSAALPKRMLPPQFNRYGGDAAHYGPHVDQAIRYHPASNQGIRTDLSCTVFLSDPADYDGGELVVGTTELAPRIKLAAGDAVLYPATDVHEVTSVTRGVRFAAFFWIESMVRSSEQRCLLHEMDMALLRLREEHGETAEAVLLTGTYHNLLRMWADT